MLIVEFPVCGRLNYSLVLLRKSWLPMFVEKKEYRILQNLCNRTASLKNGPRLLLAHVMIQLLWCSPYKEHSELYICLVGKILQNPVVPSFESWDLHRMSLLIVFSMCLMYVCIHNLSHMQDSTWSFVVSGSESAEHSALNPVGAER